MSEGVRPNGSYRWVSRVAAPAQPQDDLYTRRYAERVANRGTVRRKRGAVLQTRQADPSTNEDLASILPPDEAEAPPVYTFRPPRDREADQLNKDRNTREKAPYWKDVAMAQLPIWAARHQHSQQLLVSSLNDAVESFTATPLHKCFNGQLTCEGVQPTGHKRSVIVHALGRVLKLQHRDSLLQMPASMQSIRNAANRTSLRWQCTHTARQPG